MGHTMPSISWPRFHRVLLLLPDSGINLQRSEPLRGPCRRARLHAPHLLLVVLNELDRGLDAILLSAPSYAMPRPRRFGHHLRQLLAVLRYRRVLAALADLRLQQGGDRERRRGTPNSLAVSSERCTVPSPCRSAASFLAMSFWQALLVGSRRSAKD